MICESIRFNDILMMIINNYSYGAAPTQSILDLEWNWGTLSRKVLQHQTPTAFPFNALTLTFNNIAQATAALGILLNP